jgi:hypothetical protein
MSGPVPPLPTRSGGLALTVLCAATLMIILDGTIVTVALPAIQRDLGFAPASLSWVMNAYLIPFGGLLLLLAGRLGDLIGRDGAVPPGGPGWGAHVDLAGLGVLEKAVGRAPREGTGFGDPFSVIQRELFRSPQRNSAVPASPGGKAPPPGAWRRVAG